MVKSYEAPLAPTPAEVKAARLAAGLTQPEAAALVHWGDYRRWYEREAGKLSMPAAEWELFLLKTGGRRKVVDAIDNKK